MFVGRSSARICTKAIEKSSMELSTLVSSFFYYLRKVETVLNKMNTLYDVGMTNISRSLLLLLLRSLDDELYPGDQ